MGKRKNPPNYLDNFDAVMLRIYAERWEKADKEIIRVRDEIARVNDEIKRRIWDLQFKLGDLEHERRCAELDIMKLIKANVPQLPPPQSEN